MKILTMTQEMTHDTVLFDHSGASTDTLLEQRIANWSLNEVSEITPTN